jgi:hypothetical protein
MCWLGVDPRCPGFQNRAIQGHRKSQVLKQEEI